MSADRFRRAIVTILLFAGCVAAGYVLRKTGRAWINGWGSEKLVLSAVNVQITRYISDDNPGWVECRLTDAWGTEWLFEDKVPVVMASASAPYLDASSDYPQPGVIACQIVKRWRDDNGRDIASIDTRGPWAIESRPGTG